MWTLMRGIVDRVKVLLAIRAVQELEQEVLTAGTGRAAGLRRLATGCEAEGLPEVAADLRSKADALDAPAVSPTAVVPAAVTPPARVLPPAAVTKGRRHG